MKSRLLAPVVSALLSFSHAAGAAVVTLDFENLAPASHQVSNLQIGGFRLSPNCHYDLVGAFPGSYLSQWIGIDGLGCIPELGSVNKNFLGPSTYDRNLGPGPVMLWVDFSGNLFSFLGLDLVAPFWHISSSKGGEFFGSLPVVDGIPQTHFEFAGPEWAGIEWLSFVLTADPGSPVGVDNLTFRVPEPSTISLLFGGLAGLALVRCRKRASPQARGAANEP